MSDGKIVVTLKGGAGYDAPWIVLSGDSVPEVAEHLKNVSALGLYGEAIAASQLFTGAANVPVAGGATAPTTAAPTTAPAPAAPQASAGRFCPHGPRTRYQGSSARGAYVAWFCSLPKGHPDQCKAEFE
jgi:hypothetical protein